MIQRETKLDVADNSGAKSCKCIGILGGSGKRYAFVGDIIVVAIKEVIAGSKISSGDVKKGVVVRTKKEIGRKDGTYVRFNSNSVVLLDELGSPIGSRIFGPVPRELRDKGFMKIISLAPEVV